jgi:predicted ATP-dependent Lon-type protease
MIILVAALEPLLAIIFPDKAWDKRGVQHLKDFIQNCKRTIKALIEELDLNELYKETRTVIDENIEDKFVVDAVTSAPQDNDP